MWHRQTRRLVRTSCRSQTADSSLRPHAAEGAGGSFGGLVYKGADPVHEGSTLTANTSQRPHLQIPSPSGFGSTYKCWGGANVPSVAADHAAWPGRGERDSQGTRRGATLGPLCRPQSVASCGLHSTCPSRLTGVWPLSVGSHLQLGVQRGEQ